MKAGQGGTGFINVPLDPDFFPAARWSKAVFGGVSTSRRACGQDFLFVEH